MKNYFLLLVGFCFCQLTIAQNYNHAALSPRLYHQIQDNDPAQFHDIYIMLADAVDVEAMDKAFYERKATIAERNFEVVTTLKAKAKATQPPVLDVLYKSDFVDHGSIVALWASNTIFCKVQKETIAQLSQMPEIGWLEVRDQPKLAEYIADADASSCAMTSPNGSEPGLIAINAHKLWAMGYTGYGTNTYTIDTGTKLDHPALRNNFRGNYIDYDEAWTGGDDDPVDCNGHGSHVTGTTCGLDRLTNDTIGVAFNAKWMTGPVSGLCDDGNFLSGESSLQWALDPDNNEYTSGDIPDAINNSWGNFPEDGPVPVNCYSSGNPFINIMNALEASGIAVVWSAGNSGPGPETVSTQSIINTNLVNSFSIANVNANNLNISNSSSRGPSICDQDGQSEALIIKPEVAAPGVQVRSVSVNGGYTNNSGTSMSAPHVTGAICLLKQAFPNLTGMEIKLALYNTATDLGPAGEDNTFGKGIINCLAAFNYLVDEGNVPADPLAENDVLMVNVVGSGLNCNSSYAPEIYFENAGTSTITEAVFDYQVIGPFTDGGSYTWEGALEPGERTSFSIDPIFLLPSPLPFSFEVNCTMVNGSPDLRDLNNKFFSDFEITALPAPLPYLAGELGDGTCVGKRALLSVDLTDDFNAQWFENPIGGSILGSGPSYLTWPLLESTTFYAGVTGTVYAGLGDKEVGANEVTFQNDRGLIIDVAIPFNLHSALMYAEIAGNRRFELLNSNGDLIGSEVVDVPAGQSRVVLDMAIPAGTDMELIVSNGAPLYFNTGGVNYPYSYPGVVTIKEANDNTNNYYFFYDWEIEYSCNRVPVTVEVGNAADGLASLFAPSILQADINENIDFTNNSTNAVSYVWNFGDGSSSTEENPSHSYAANGEYVVTLESVNAAGCTDFAMIEITVGDGVGVDENQQLSNNIRVFPNPASSRVNIQFDFDTPKALGIHLVDMLGRTVHAIPQQNYMIENIDFSTSHLQNGIYNLVFFNEDQQSVKKLVIVQ